ncbi:hypothetical protein QAD02_022266 [Eretmocerus hayati]|uniref:Uncharacterized protein n=1 Tax=Eretmocerus hayati TaxID=131215 RepID=A0ACC2PVT8_9HYME|nr:hypothetical protein QAD02_022266 [Eretmocerus hayati]
MDVKRDILDQVLNFIYSGKVSMSDDNVSDVCAASEKFTLHDLKAQCSQYLILNLSSDNAVKVLIVASTNNMPELRKKCFTFINKHAHSVIETEDYKNLAAAFPFLLDELYRHLVNSVLPRPPSRT